jgi:hypothetical protein
MRIGSTLFALLLASSMDVRAQAPHIERVDVTEYGLYTTSVVSAGRDANGILQSTLNNIKHTETSRDVPAKLGVRFGFMFRVIGAPNGAQVHLKKITTFPTAGLQNPASKEAIRRSEVSVTTIIGEETYIDYGFDDPWELVPGPWTIELWDGDRKLASQGFKVFKP